MAWDATLPNNQTKIRNYPTVLTANFAAVEQGGDTLQQWKANFIERNAITAAPPATPTRIDNVMQVYSRQNDTDSKTDLFILDDRATANEIQLTENGSIGGAAQNFILNQFKFEDNATTYNQGNIVKARGSFNSSGTLTNGSNMATAGTPHPSTGVYNVNVNADVLEAGTSYQVYAVPTSSASGNARTLYIVSKPTVVAATAVTIQIKISNGSTIVRDESFDVMVVGGV